MACFTLLLYMYYIPLEKALQIHPRTAVIEPTDEGISIMVSNFPIHSNKPLLQFAQSLLCLRGNLIVVNTLYSNRS